MNKYKNKIVFVDGIRFHSILESKRYLFLKCSKKVKSFKRQVPFIVAKYGNKVIKYYADFVVEWESDHHTVEDVKGYRTQLYVLKSALVYEKYGKSILEIDKHNLTIEF